MFLQINWTASSGVWTAKVSYDGVNWTQRATGTLATLNYVGIALRSRHVSVPALGQVLYYSDTGNP